MKKSQIFFYLCLSFLAGVFIWSAFFYAPPKFENQQVELIGVISAEPDVRLDQIKYTVRTPASADGFDKLTMTASAGKQFKNILVSAPLYPPYQYGDQLKIKCELQSPSKIENFEYDRYLARYHIYQLCYQPKIELISHNQGNFFLAKIYQFKNYLISRLNQILPEPQSSFLNGLLIGARSSIPADLQNAFSRTGTSHIVAVSGYNISIIVAFLISLLITLGLDRKKSFYVITIIIIIFVILTGASASVVRAGIMGFIVLLAKQLGRPSRIRNTLILTATIMVIINPLILVYDMGFQLSFLATLGLVYISPILTKIIKVEKIKWPALKIILGDYLLTTLSAMILTAPLILFKLGKFSFIAPLANILVLPLIPIAMMLGFITLIGAMIWLKLGWVLGWGVWLILSLIIFIIEHLSALPWASL